MRDYPERQRAALRSVLALALGLVAGVGGARAGAGPAWLARWSGPATVGTEVVVLPLERAPVAAFGDAASGPVSLVLVGVRAETPSGATYNLFVGPRGPARSAAGDPGYVGTLSLFDLAGRAEGGDRAFPLPPEARRTLAADPARPLVLTIAPRGGDGSPLVVGGARLVREPSD